MNRMSTVTPPEPADTATALLVSLTRMEGKLDTHLAKHEALAENVRDHEGRIRKVEDRIQKTISPLGLWTTVLGALGGVGVLVAVYTNLAA